MKNHSRAVTATSVGIRHALDTDVSDQPLQRALLPIWSFHVEHAFEHEETGSSGSAAHGGEDAPDRRGDLGRGGTRQETQRQQTVAPRENEEVTVGARPCCSASLTVTPPRLLLIVTPLLRSVPLAAHSPVPHPTALLQRQRNRQHQHAVALGSPTSGKRYLRRCQWAPGEDPTNPLIPYHDEEWGRPSRDDRHLFEMLCLEGAQVLPSAACDAVPVARPSGQPAEPENRHSVEICAMTAETSRNSPVSNKMRGREHSTKGCHDALPVNLSLLGSCTAGGSQLADHPQAEGRLPEGVRRLGRRRRRGFQRRGGALSWKYTLRHVLIVCMTGEPSQTAALLLGSPKFHNIHR